MKSWLPSPQALARETVVVLAGAVLAAFVMRQFPGLRSYVRDSLNLT